MIDGVYETSGVHVGGSANGVRVGVVVAVNVAVGGSVAVGATVAGATADGPPHAPNTKAIPIKLIPHQRGCIFYSIVPVMAPMTSKATTTTHATAPMPTYHQIAGRAGGCSPA